MLLEKKRELLIELDDYLVALRVRALEGLLMITRLGEIPERYQPARKSLLCGVRPGRDAQLGVYVGEMALNCAF